MPRVRLFTDEQEAAALVEFNAANGKHGIVADLARRYGCGHSTMLFVLKRARAKATSEIAVSRETTNSTGAQP